MIADAISDAIYVLNKGKEYGDIMLPSIAPTQATTFSTGFTYKPGMPTSQFSIPTFKL